MNSVLFVDDEPNILSGIRRMLRPQRHSWEFKVAESGEEALKLMEQEHFDILISDMRMPGMNGVELLNTVKKLYPKTIRLALSGHAEIKMELECAQTAHQFLMKPIGADTLVSTMQAAIELQNALNNEDLQKVVAEVGALPSLPSLYQDILKETSSPDGSLKQVGNIISKDVAMTAKILQLVNSAFFGLSSHVSSPAEAATILGLDTLKSLVLTNGVFSAFETASNTLNLDQLTHHSLQVGILAGKLAKAEGMPRKTCDLAVMTGMLQDTGKLILAAHLKLPYEESASRPHWQWEKQQIGITHAELGAYLLGIWGLPNPMVEAVMYHHHPANCPNQSLSALTVTHIANALMNWLEDTDDNDNLEDYLDMGYLKNLNIDSRIDDWKQIALDTFHNQEQEIA